MIMLLAFIYVFIGCKMFNDKNIYKSKSIHGEVLNKYSLWYKNPLNPLYSFIDLSHLNNKPAGNHGFNTSSGDKFKFTDGTAVKFFGTNIEASTLFVKNKNLIKKHAKRLASLGFNLVRLHHHDSFWVVPNLLAKGSTTQHLNKESLDAYFWWVKCLRDEGIYIWVDLQVQRPWKEGDDIPGWATDMAPTSIRGMNIGKGFIYLNTRMQELTKKFNEKFLTKINPYTNLALKDDPAVMGIMITNENDITQHYGNNFLKSAEHPYHKSIFDDEVESFSNMFALSKDKVRKVWLPGESKYLLNDLEARFNRDMIKHLHELGVKVPISTTSMWGGRSNLFALPALSTGDMIDAHGYVDKSNFNKNQLNINPVYNANFLHQIGQAQLVGKPFTITEYNVGEQSDLSNAYLPTILVSSMAAFQGWDAIMLYGYSHDGFKGNRASPWSSYMHPSILGVIPAMALLYREDHVALANKSVVLSPSEYELFMKETSSRTSTAIRTALEQHRLSIAIPKSRMLPWLSASKIPKNAIVINDLNKNLLVKNQNFVISDTGEIQRNWSKGIMTVNTPKSQLIVGRVGGRVIDLGDINVKVQTDEAAIILTSLDKNPISVSGKILVSAVAKVTKANINGNNSYISEPVKAEINFISSVNGLHLIALKPDGSKGLSMPLFRNENGKYTFTLSEKYRTHWYMIVK